MDHNGAIAVNLLPLLIGLVCGLAGWAVHSIRRVISMNDMEHLRLTRQSNKNAIEIARIETRLHMRREGDHEQDTD